MASKEQRVTLMHADAFFDRLAPGEYTAIVRHELVEPQVARFDVTIMTDTELLMIQFIYLEPELVLLSKRTILAQQ